jgi:ribose 5-phosphate isomerase B
VSASTVTRVAVGSDAATSVTGAVVEHLERRGLEPVLFGPLAGKPASWVAVAADVGRAVASGVVDAGVLMCFTGTGVSIAANKVPGVRAALCTDAQTATGARRWNDANVLVLSYRLVSRTVAVEVIDAFLEAGPDADIAGDLAALTRLEQRAD